MINKHGIVHYQIKKGYYDSEEYIEFLREARRKLPRSQKLSLYQDGAPIHTTRNVWEPAGAQMVPGVKFVKCSTLDEPSEAVTTANFWVSSAASWAPIDRNIACFDENPVG